MLDSSVKRQARRPAAVVKRPPSALRPVGAAAPPAQRSRATTSTARRPLALLVVMALCGAGLFSRLVFWQVMQHNHLTRLATLQQASSTTQPLRGTIWAGTGEPFAAEGTADSVWATVSAISNPARTAAALAPLVHVRARDLERNFESGALYVPVARGLVPNSVGQKIQALNLPGIAVKAQPVRMYPNNTTAAQVVGYLDADGTGQYGIEQEFNAPLAGTASLKQVVAGMPGSTVRPLGAQLTTQNGADIHLSLNSTIQNEAEAELSAAVHNHHADGGTIIVMDPRTGYILALANNPSFDPGKYVQYADRGETSRFMDPAIEDTYEPGSTFKIVTMAAGLDTGRVTPNTAFYDGGVWLVDGQALHNWNDLPNGEETMTQVLQHSANVGASFVASKLGAGLFYKYVRAFGIGRPTGISLPGEAPGTLWQPGDKGWSDVTLYTNSFGQGVTATPLQMVRAVAAVANNGVMMKPQIVRSVVYRGRLIQTHPVVQGRPISARTAHTLTHMLVQSAIGGEAALGLVKGYDIAAKTGTANVADGHGGYIQGDTIASIVGYAPAEHPRYIVLVKIDHPRDTLWGSMAAAPVLKDMFQDLFVYAHIPPSTHALNR